MKFSAPSLAFALALAAASCATVPPTKASSGQQAATPAEVTAMSASEADQGPSRETLKALVEMMRFHIERNDYALAQSAFDTLENRLPPAEEDPLREPFVAELRRLDAQAKDLAEFERTQRRAPAISDGALLSGSSTKQQ